jgi:hypothetical protein
VGRTRRALPAAVVSAVLLVTGCGADGGGTTGAAGWATNGTEGTPSGSSSAGAPTGDKPSDVAGGPEVDPAAPGFPPRPTARRVSREGFTSPTGNIVCQLSRTAASCVIGDRDYAVPAQQGCGSGRSALFSVLTRGPASFGACEGGVVVPRSSLPYGTTGVVGPMSCLDRQTGMVCWNSRTGHGFRVARATYDLH